MPKQIKPSKIGMSCPSCWGKGYSTQYYGLASGRGLVEARKIHKKVCPTCNGRPREYMRRQIKTMLISVRNGAFITPVLERIMTMVTPILKKGKVK